MDNRMIKPLPTPPHEAAPPCEETLPATPAVAECEELTPRRTLAQRVRARLPRLPHFSDDTQRKAGQRVLQFFAAILLLTLVARGTAGATLPVVQTTTPASCEIVQSVQGSGNVNAKQSNTLDAPEGLTVKEVLVTPGQKVSEGDPLLQFDLAELADQLARAENKLNGLRVELSILQQASPHDASSVNSAQTSFDWAQQDYNNTVTQGQANIAAAQDTLNAATQAATDAANALAALPPDATPEQRANAESALAAANTAKSEAEAALIQAQTEAQTAEQSAARSLETARQALTGAQQRDSEARQSAANNAAQNTVSAAEKQMDIAAAQEKVDVLHALIEANGFLSADEAGTVLEIPEPGSKTTGGTLARLAGTEGGYIAEVWLDKKDAEKLTPGGSAEVTTEGGSLYYRPTVSAQILAVGEADESNRVKVTLSLPQGSWKQGQTVQVRMVQSRATYTQCLPLTALRSGTGGYYVLVVRQRTTVLGIENELVAVPVTVTAQDATNVAVEGYLAPGEKVVTNSSKPVEEGSRVRLQEE